MHFIMPGHMFTGQFMIITSMLFTEMKLPLPLTEEFVSGLYSELYREDHFLLMTMDVCPK